MPRALITGASRGFGHALASALVERGWQLIVTARDPLVLEAAVAGLDGDVHAMAGDVADPAHRARLLRAADDGIDLLVNNASELGPSPLEGLAETSEDEVRRVLEVNVVAPLALAVGALPLLRPGAAVVNLSSDAAVEAYEGWGAYGASKAALDHATAVLAAEHPGVGFYAFDPGDMRTDMHQAAFPNEDISDRPLPATVVPALLRLLEQRPQSGRYVSSDFQGVAA